MASTPPAEAATSVSTISSAVLMNITRPYDLLVVARFCQLQKAFTVVGLVHGETLNCWTFGWKGYMGD